MKIKNLNKMVGIVFGVFTLLSGFVSNSSVLAKGNILAISEEDIPNIVMNVSYKERLVDLGDLSKYRNLYDILENISSTLNFECFCGLDCFEEHLCTYKRGKQDSLSIILTGLGSGINKSLTQDILKFFQQINKCDTASQINFYYTIVANK